MNLGAELAPVRDVGDTLGELIEALGRAALSSDLVIVSGGMGGSNADQTGAACARSAITPERMAAIANFTHTLRSGSDEFLPARIVSHAGTCSPSARADRPTSCRSRRPGPVPHQ